MTPFRFLSLFSGIEAASTAWLPLGWQCVAVSEIEGFPCEALRQRHPGVPNLGDITAITEDQVAALGHIDLIVFGSPCQDLSVAGKRKGFTDTAGDFTRSGLFFAAMRIIGWARKHCGLRFALWENVPGAFSSNNGADFAAVVGHLGGMDPSVSPKGWGTEGAAIGTEAMVEWSTLDAQWFGVAQRRRRVFALADFGDWAGRPPILLESYRLRGDTAPSRQAGQDVAGTLASSLGRRGGTPDCGSTPGHLQPVGLQRPVLTCVSNAEGAKPQVFLTCSNLAKTVNNQTPLLAFDSRQDCVSSTEVFGALSSSSPQAQAVCFAENSRGELRLEGGDGQRTGELSTGGGKPGQGQPVIAYGFQPRIARNGRGDMGEVASALTAQAGETGKGDAAPCVAVCITGDRTHALRAEVFDASEDGTGRGQPIVNVPMGCDGAIDGPVPPLMARSSRGGAQTLSPGHQTDGHMIGLGTQVRRLTPRECERLQGFHDDYTLVTSRGKPAADGPRYKALGNSMAVPVMAWIGRQIDFAMLFDMAPAHDDLFA